MRGKYGRWAAHGLSLLPILIGGVGSACAYDGLSCSAYLSPFVAGVLSHTFMNYPLIFRLVDARYGAYDSGWTQSAQGLGASSWRAWRTVHCTFMVPAFVHAFCLATSLSVTEIGALRVGKGEALLTVAGAVRIYRAANMHHAVIGTTLILLCIVLVIALIAMQAQQRHSRVSLLTHGILPLHTITALIGNSPALGSCVDKDTSSTE